MGADLSNIVKTQKLTDDHVQFLVYQLLRGLKVSNYLHLEVTCLSLDHFTCSTMNGLDGVPNIHQIGWKN